MALMASVAIIMIGFLVVVPEWTYVLQREKEEELISRGFEIVRAIRSWQKANNGALPTSLKQMVEGRHLRKEYADPFATTEKAKSGGGWFYVSPAQPRQECTLLNQPGAPGDAPPTNLTPAPPHPRDRRPNAERIIDPARQVARAGLLMEFFAVAEPVRIAQDRSPEDQNPPGDGQPMGGFSGVMSRSTKESYAVFNTKNRYNKWCFSLDTIPENFFRPDFVTFVLMKFPKERKPEFTGAGKKAPDRSKRQPREGDFSGFDSMPTDTGADGGTPEGQ
jgi:type II secretory pathway pseudopilin PulG